MAHELLHNCGAWMHDNQIIKTSETAIKMMRPNWNGTCLVGSLMNSHVTNYKGSYIISECAKDQMLFHLFNKTRKLVDKHQCLVIENNLNKQKNLKKYIDKAKNEHNDVRNVSFKKIYEFKNSVRPVFAQEFST